MQVSSNTTGMEVGLTVATDKSARDHCVVVVKGTFEADASGAMSLAREQQPLVYADEHYGDPATTAIRYESEFCLEKPCAEVIVVGKAVPPGDRPAARVAVRLEVNGRSKDAVVFGDRRWRRTLTGVEVSSPLPFREISLAYDRAFGGEDDSAGAGKIATDLRNVVGVGFNKHRGASEMIDRALPNLERPDQFMASYRDTPEPIGFGVMTRACKQRVDFAGTYDQNWIDEVCPFLPMDFDSRYFMSTAQDQWFPFFSGGEVIRCVHMAQQPLVKYVLPAIAVPVSFQFDTALEQRAARLDTVIVEPHFARAMLIWRASAPLGKKIAALRSVAVGAASSEDDMPSKRRHGKPYFHGLSDALRWLRKYRDAP